MAVTLFSSRLPADATQREHLRTLFLHPGFQILKGMVASNAAESQIKVMERAMYPENEVGKDIGRFALERAIALNHFLDVIDDFEKDDTLWFMSKIEPRR